MIFRIKQCKNSDKISCYAMILNFVKFSSVSLVQFCISKGSKALIFNTCCDRTMCSSVFMTLRTNACYFSKHDYKNKATPNSGFLRALLGLSRLDKQRKLIICQKLLASDPLKRIVKYQKKKKERKCVGNVRSLPVTSTSRDMSRTEQRVKHQQPLQHQEIRFYSTRP